MIHTDLILAMRSRLLSLVVCSSSADSLTVVNNAYVRNSGSFVDDKFAVGMEIQVTGFDSPENNGRKLITAVTPVSITVREVLVGEADASGRSITVGIPADRAWENIAFEPNTDYPFIEEDYAPAPPELYGSYTAGLKKATGLYVIKWYGMPNVGISALFRCTDALIQHFPPGYDVINTPSCVAQVSPENLPYRSSLINNLNSKSVITVTIPYRAYTPQHLN